MTRSIGTSWLNQMLATGWTSATIHAYLLKSSTLFNPTTDLFLSSIPGIDRAAGPITVTGKTVSGGFFDGADVNFTLANAVVAGWFVIVQIGGSEATSPIVGSTNERADFSPFLITGNGGTVTCQIQSLGMGRI